MIMSVVQCVGTVVNDVLVVLFFFFFQAEDGIRDVAVTGVQTCALPISLARATAGTAMATPMSAGAKIALSLGAAAGLGRSGERRGGEEGRSRGAPDYLKKKKEQRRRQLSRRHQYPTTQYSLLA